MLGHPRRDLAERGDGVGAQRIVPAHRVDLAHVELREARAELLHQEIGLAHGAIDLPRVHVDGDVLHLEGGLMDVAPEGWKPVRWAGRNLFFGGVSAVERRRDGTLAAAGDPRRGGHGIVVG